MAIRSGKIWGLTELLISHPTFEVHRIEANEGGFCSKHKHEYRYNMFYVENGKMIIRVWQNDYDLCDTTILEPGDQISVPPNVYHHEGYLVYLKVVLTALRTITIMRNVRL